MMTKGEDVFGDVFTLPQDDEELGRMLRLQIGVFVLLSGGRVPRNCYVHDDATARRVAKLLPEEFYIITYREGGPFEAELGKGYFTQFR